MISAQEWREIRGLIAQMATVILSGNTAKTDSKNVESIDNLYPGHPTIEDRPVAHPYGLMSRAPAGTVQVTARQGDHPANRLVLLHRDENRPAVAEGDVWLYDNHGNQVKLIDGKVVVKSNAIELGEGATKGVARVGDLVQIDSTATLVGTIAKAGPVPAISAGDTVTLTLTAPTIQAKIMAGSSKVTAAD